MAMKIIAFGIGMRLTADDHLLIFADRNDIHQYIPSTTVVATLPMGLVISRDR